MRSGKWTAPVGVLAAVVVIATACGSSSKSASNTNNTSTTAAAAAGPCNSPGVTSSSILIGTLGPQAGPVAPSFAPLFTGFQARVNSINASGGVNGRKIELTAANDGGLDPTQNLNGAQELVQQKNAFGIFEATDIDQGSGSFLNQNSIPVVGYNVSNTWGQYNNMFGYSGSNSPKPQPKTTDGDFLKLMGVKKLGIIAVNIAPSINAATEEKVSAQHAGVAVPVDDTSAGVLNSVWTTQAQELKSAGVDAVYAPITATQSFPLYQAIQQAGLKLKLILFPQGYALDVPSKLGSAASGAVFSVDVVPFDDPADTTGNGHSMAKADFEKYAAGQSVSDQLIDGWLSAQMLITGLQKAGSCPTRSAFITNLRNDTSYDGLGWFSPALNLKTTFGQPYGLCFHYVQIEGTKLTMLNGGKAVCGTPITTG